MIGRHTKIIATLGPATDDPEILKGVLQAGANILRMNLSHGDRIEHAMRLITVRNCAKALGLDIKMLADLQGPKIRIRHFHGAKVWLETGQTFTLDPHFLQAGDQNVVGVDYQDLAQDLDVGDTLLLNDGLIQLIVIKIEGSKIHCQVEKGGRLSDHKGVNRCGGGLNIASLTTKDYQDLQWVAEMDFDYVAVSFPRHAQDIINVRTLLTEFGSCAGIMAKIECREAIAHLEDIMMQSDAIMVARGDLSIEVGYAKVPALQQHIVRQARSLNKAVVIATQMMESMIQHSMPTCAEVSDVSHAVLQGTDAVMLSAETAAGHYPVEAVSMMSHICFVAESHLNIIETGYPPQTQEPLLLEQALAMSVAYTAKSMDAAAIVVMSGSDEMVSRIAHLSVAIPIYLKNSNAKQQSCLALYRGVYPLECTECDQFDGDGEEIFLSWLVKKSILQSGDRVIVVRSEENPFSEFIPKMAIVSLP